MQITKVTFEYKTEKKKKKINKYSNSKKTELKILINITMYNFE